MQSGLFQHNVEVLMQEYGEPTEFGFRDTSYVSLFATRAGVSHIKSNEQKVDGVVVYNPRKKVVFRKNNKTNLLDTDCIIRIDNRHYFNILDIDDSDMLTITLYVERCDV